MLSSAYVRSSERHDRVHQFFGLIRALVARELTGRYRRSMLGPAWAVLQPLFYMVIFTFIRQVLGISTGSTPYAIFTYSALVPWTFFANAVTRCGVSFYVNRGIVQKMSVPREVFPLAEVVTSLFDFLIASVILAGMMIWFHVPVGLSLLWLPVLMFLVSALAMGIGFGVAAVGTYKRDIVFGMPFLLQFWLLATPIMYTLEKVPDKWQFLYRLNPMVGIVEGFRSVLVHGTAPDGGLLMISFAGVAVVWAVTWPLFRYVGQYFADVL